MKLIEHVFVVRVGKPVRCMLDRDEDMMSTGTRHPFLAKYKVLYISVIRLYRLWRSVFMRVRAGRSHIILCRLHAEKKSSFQSVIFWGYLAACPLLGHIFQFGSNLQRLTFTMLYNQQLILFSSWESTVVC